MQGSTTKEPVDMISWPRDFLPHCIGETIRSSNFVSFAVPGEYCKQGRVVITTFQILYKLPGAIEAGPVRSFPLMGLISAELQPEPHGYATLSLVGAHYRKLAICFMSKKQAGQFLAQLHELVAAITTRSMLPAFQSPELISKWPHTPAEVNVRSRFLFVLFVCWQGWMGMVLFVVSDLK